jgi:hypothetical protein
VSHWLGAKSARSYRVPWNLLDLTDPEQPRLTCPVAELRRAA